MINCEILSDNEQFATYWDRHDTIETDNFAQKDSKGTIPLFLRFIPHKCRARSQNILSRMRCPVQWSLLLIVWVGGSVGHVRD